MKTITRIFAPLAVLGALVSCQMYEVDTQMTPEKAAASIRMECSAVDSYNLPAQSPDAITFNVSSTTPWTLSLSSGADWLEVTPASSASSALVADVTVTAKANTSFEDRSATLTLRGENIATTKVITIKQARAGKLFVTPMVKDYSTVGGPLTFTIQTNLPWEVRSSEGWITFNRENGEPDPLGRTLSIIATAAPSEVLERTATITVTAGDDEESFDVVQKGIFTIVEPAGSFESAGGDLTFTLKTDLPWTVTPDKDWISFNPAEGVGDGSSQVITATATANDGALRTATVTVTAGGVARTIEMSQKGFDFEILAPESNVFPDHGGEILLTVKASMAWEPVSAVNGWTVEKVDATSFKVKAAFNNIFKDKTGVVSITGPGGAQFDVELTQPCAFTFSGHTEVLEDGSVKIYGDQVSRCTLVNPLRYASFILTMGEKSFSDKAQMWLYSKDATSATEIEIQNQITLGTRVRVRLNGNLPGSGLKTYDSQDYAMTQDELNAMTEYRVDILPSASSTPHPVTGEPVGHLNLSFSYNGVLRSAVLDKPSIFAEDPTAAAHYWFGTYDSAGDTSYYVVKTCDVIIVEE